jgi:Holliday junction resolvase RusA-like endonuclease
MNIRIFIPDFEPMSKQHANHRSHGGNGRMMFTDKGYTAAKRGLNFLAKVEFAKRGWTQPTKELCALRVWYRANRMNVDNAGGFVQDALEGVAYFKDGQVDIATYHKRRTGPIGIGIIVRTLKTKRSKP